MNKRDKILRLLRHYKKNQEYRIELLADDILALDQPQEEIEEIEDSAGSWTPNELLLYEKQIEIIREINKINNKINK